MFRYEVGTRVLVRRCDWGINQESIEVEILDKEPANIKVMVLSGGWWKLGEIIWLSNPAWYILKRVR